MMIISNNACNKYGSTVTVIPMTSKKKKEELPTHLWIENGCLPGLKPSMFLADQVTTISKTDLRFCVGTITDTGQLSMIEEALKAQLNFTEPALDDEPEEAAADAGDIAAPELQHIILDEIKTEENT